MPTDDIELCRLAELGRELAAWDEVRAGALRGWIVATDGRMYHPVVAEGVNNAIAAKAAQRTKTAKARLAALEKHLKQATSPAEIDRLKEEIRKLSLSAQIQSQESVTDSVTDPVTESKEKETEKDAKARRSAPPAHCARC